MAQGTIVISGIQDVRSMLLALGAEMKSAGDKAQNTMAYQIMGAEKLEMIADLDRPTPWAQGSLRYKKAGETGGLGAPQVEGAAVYFESAWGYTAGLDPEEYLGVQIVGGQTGGPKRSEVRLQQIGLMRADQVWVPAPGVKLDSYGNVPGPTISAMLSDLGANPYAARADGTCCHNFTWIGTPPNDVKGILARIGDDWLPFLFFVSRVATYTERYDFHGRAEAEVEYGWKAIWEEQIAYSFSKL